MKSALRYIAVLMLIAAVMTACAGAPNNVEPNTAETPTEAEPTATPVPTVEPTEEEAPVVLTVVGLEDTVSLTMADLQAMDVVEGYSGTISSTGTIVPPQYFKGVRMTDLADLVGGLTEDVGINIVAKDGYGITMSYDQITNGNFIVYNPGTGEEMDYDAELTPIVAFERDGAPIPDEEDGPLRAFVISEENDQIIDGHWSVKWTNTLEIRPVAADWILYLEGVLTEEIDRVSFESCSAPGCHQAVWTDGDGNEWSGVPLYYFAGRVDDGVVHEDRAFNEDYAEAGYSIELFAADGYNVSIDSAQAMFNSAILLANQFNGEPLDEDLFPLRLVGEELENKAMAGQITQIVLNPHEGVTPPSAEDGEVLDLSLPEGTALKVMGAVRNELVLDMAQLEMLGVQENVSVEHSKKGTLTYTGVALNDILAFAGVDADATILVMYAADGYNAEIALADLAECTNCLIAFEDDGTLSTAMDGLSGGMWVGNLVALQVKTGAMAVEEEPVEEPAAEEETSSAGTPSDATMPEGATLEVAGVTFTAADLDALGVVDVEMEHPKNGPTMYSGVLVTTVLEAAGVDTSATTLVITASDGYSAEVALSDVLACTNCLVAIGDDGTLAMAMGELPSGTWVKDVVTLEIQ